MTTAKTLFYCGLHKPRAELKHIDGDDWMCPECKRGVSIPYADFVGKTELTKAGVSAFILSDRNEWYAVV